MFLLRRLARRIHPRERLFCRNYSSDGLPKPRLDLRSIADNVVFKSHNAFNRRAPIPPGAPQNVARMYQEQKTLLFVLNQKRAFRSDLEIRIKACAKDPANRASLLEEARLLKIDIAALETQMSTLEGELLNLALTLPNDTHPSTPIGSESAATILSMHGPEPSPADPAADHVCIGRRLSLFDLESAATTTGTSWYYLTNEGALLELALTNFALSIALRRGFQFVTTPDVVRCGIAARCGFRPRDDSDPPVHQMYHIARTDPNTPELVLAGTAEIPLGGMFANKVFEESALPVKLAGLGTAFRAEAGARGADTRGLYRVHQFRKLELFAVTTENASELTMEEIKDLQIEIFSALHLPFRVLDMPTEELGASAYRKYDMEAWMPGRGSWGEISSTSNCTDYQARRLHIRYRRTHPSSSPTASNVPFAHTLNGTAVAIPRLIVAIIENGAHIQADQNLLPLPSCLQSFWVGGTERIYWY